MFMMTILSLIQFDDNFLYSTEDDIQERLKEHDTFAIPTDREMTFKEWKAGFLKLHPKPLPPPSQAQYMKLEKNHSLGSILCWMFVKGLHCMVVKREHIIEYFRSLLSFLSVPYYDVSTLASLGVINLAEDPRFKLFNKKLRLEKRRGWKDELYKPQFP
ncbi:hypothetical protein Hanom_Chr08g00708571 [Helianthus anomalus]